MTVAVYLPFEDKTQWWVEMLQELMPGWDIAALEGITNPDDVTYAVVWRPRTGDLAKFSNLKAIVSIGARLAPSSRRLSGSTACRSVPPNSGRHYQNRE